MDDPNPQHPVLGPEREARGLVTGGAKRPAARGGRWKSLDARGNRCNVSGGRWLPSGGPGDDLEALGRRLLERPWEAMGCAEKLLECLGGRCKPSESLDGKPCVCVCVSMMFLHCVASTGQRASPAGREALRNAHEDYKMGDRFASKHRDYKTTFV